MVCLSAPVRDRDGGAPLNVDADVLAAALSNALGADHLRLVTGTAGLLTDPSDPASTLPHAYQGEAARYAGGRMRQKVRAAEMALEGGSADIAITGPHTLAGRSRLDPVLARHRPGGGPGAARPHGRGALGLR